jgi:glucosamine--fructose-6-phosphate aminotransferase (isomerizing)
MVIHPSVMLDQSDALADDLVDRVGRVWRDLQEPATHPRWAGVDRVYLVGDGDSHHASRSTEMAFVTQSGVACAPLSAQRFLDYRIAWLSPETARRTLVIGCSASGTTERVVQCLAAARQRGALTLAVTGTADSPLVRAAELALLVPQARKVRSPGILTYQATLVALLVSALRLGVARGLLSNAEVRGRLDELRALADVVAATNQAVAEDCRLLAARINRAPAIGVLGSGPSHGTALYAAAKLVEGAGVLAFGQDLEEWWHVERFARPLDIPIFVLAPPGRSQHRALELARRARSMGRNIVLVADGGHPAPGIPDGATGPIELPVHGQVREEFSALVYHVFASRTAAHLAESLGRLPFLGDLAR